MRKCYKSVQDLCKKLPQNLWIHQYDIGLITQFLMGVFSIKKKSCVYSFFFLFFFISLKDIKGEKRTKQGKSLGPCFFFFPFFLRPQRLIKGRNCPQNRDQVHGPMILATKWVLTEILESPRAMKLYLIIDVRNKYVQHKIWISLRDGKFPFYIFLFIFIYLLLFLFCFVSLTFLVIFIWKKKDKKKNNKKFL